MRSFARVMKQLWTVGALSLVLATGACGDDSGGNPDARQNPDGNVDAIVPDGAVDATPPAMRSGLIGVLQVSVTNTLPGGSTASGGVVSVGINDPTNPLATSTVIYNDGTPTDGCTVRQYIVGGDGPNPDLDEGAIEITGDINPSPFPACVFNSTLGEYYCPSAASGGGATTIDVTHDAPSSGLTLYKFANATFDMTTQREVGMVVNVSGLPSVTTTAGSLDINNGTFGIVSVVSSTEVAVVNTKWVGCNLLGACSATGQNASGEAGGYGVIAGASPIIPGFNLFKSRTGVCTDGTTACTVRTEATDCTGQTPATCDTAASTPIEITIAKTTDATGDEVLGQFSDPIKPSGEGLTLATSSARPEAMPTATDAAVTVACNDGTDGNCGVRGELVTGLAVSARTTDTTPDAANPIDMPAATTSYTTLFCTKIGADTMDIPQAAWAAFLSPGGSNPGVTQTYTRFETQVLRLGAKTAPIDGQGILRGAGYGLVGYTDAP